MSDYDSDKLKELCDHIDLLEYASTTVEFEQRGTDEYAAHCPRHIDKTPSLMITPSKGLFFCHSCHVGGNIINWIMTFEHKSFNEAVQKVSGLAGIDIQHIKVCQALKFYKQLKQLSEQHTTKPIERTILPESYLDQFAHEIPQEWVDEGISADAMKMYGICIDYSANRICYPIYDNNDNLIGVKGRSRFKNYQELKIKKYLNYQKIQTTDFLVGLKYNREPIMQAGSVIVFEGIKSGLKLCSWGLPNNWVTAETSRLNESQIRILLEMHIPEVIIAFDRDVDMKEIRQCTAMLRKFCNVFAVRDRYNKNRLLPGDKDSPVDAGKEAWLQLLEEKVRL